MNTNTHWFLAPCALLDLEAMQTWLEDMALAGYLLKNSNKSGHSFEFYKIEPLPMRYRLTPVSDNIEQWNLRPGEEFVSITETYGWEYVCTVRRFHIFRSYDESARELHTDPVIQAQGLRQLQRRILKTILAWLSLPICFWMLLFLSGGTDHFWQNVLNERTGFPITFGFLALMATIPLVTELVKLGMLHHRMKRGWVATNRKEWKKKAPIHRAFSRLYPVVLCVLTLLALAGRISYREQADYQKLPAVGTDLPFLSVADMAQYAGVESAERMEDADYMRHWSHILSSDNYEWVEIVEVSDLDGNEGLVSIHLAYHEVNFSWLAEQLTEEYLSDAREYGTEMTNAPQTDADFSYFYCDAYGAPAAVLRYGNTVIHVTFPRSDIEFDELKFEYWVENLDQHLAHT